MQTMKALYLRRTLVAALSAAVLTGIGFQPASGQSTPKKTNSVSRKSTEDKDRMARMTEMDWDGDESDPTRVDPAPMSYPFAAPGGINLYHWTDYTRTNWAEGSVQDEREARMELQDRRRKARAERLKNLAGSTRPVLYKLDESNGISNDSAYDPQSDTQGGNSVDARGRNGQGMSGNRRGMGWSSMGRLSPLATFGDYVYVVRGTTLFKLNNSDLSVVAQKDLPAFTQPNNPLSGSISADGIGTSAASDANGHQGNTTGVDSQTNGTGAGSQNGNSATDTQNSNGTAASPNGVNGADSSRGRNNRRSTRRNGNGSNSFGSAYSDEMGAGMSSWPISLTAGADYLFVLRGNTLYEMRTSDLSLVTQRDLPLSGTNGANGNINGINGNLSAPNGTNGKSASPTDTNSNGTKGDAASPGGNGTSENPK